MDAPPASLSDPTPFLAIRTGYAVYRGPVADGVIHRHAAFQIAVAPRGEVTMVDAGGARHSSAALVVAPMTPHRLLGAADLLTFYVEPHCVFADGLRSRYPVGIAAAPELRNLREDDVAPTGGGPSRTVDARVAAALDVLRGGDTAMPDLAAFVGLSPQRLRALTRQMREMMGLTPAVVLPALRSPEPRG
ncbi:AraC family transcriptional regulator [Tsukamurella soli]|uniref:AraC family transcriptional regulator n=1 Tax=Tsukamurella soli TaxID=644556 RepID=A0ABP8JCD3_9ACTN